MNEHLLAAAQEAPEQEEATIQSMMAYASALDEKTHELKDLEALVKAKKKEVNKINDTLPGIMSQLGMHSMELENGNKITIKEDVSCRVVDIDKLYTFLDARGDAALVKTSISMGKLPKEILEAVISTLEEKFGIEATGGLSIHPMTLNSYFRKLCGVGGKTKCEVPVAAVDEEMVQIYTYNKVTVKV